MSGNERSQATIQLAQTALMAALCYIGFQFLRIDIPIGGDKTAIHLGNAFCVLGALLLGGLKGGLAGAVGMTIADLTEQFIKAQISFDEVLQIVMHKKIIYASDATMQTMLSDIHGRTLYIRFYHFIAA